MSRIVAIDRREQAAYFLLFLFPIAVNSVRHWASTIFTLLCLLSFSYPYWRKVMLTAWEKYLLALFAACFAAFMISNLVNGWGEKQTGVLGVEIRYLLLFPCITCCGSMTAPRGGYYWGAWQALSCCWGRHYMRSKS